MMKIKAIVISLLILVSHQVFALKLDSMLTTGDQHGNGVYTLTNDLDSTSFITGEISKLNVVNGEIEIIPYTKENLKDWEITLTSPKLILESGRVKQVGVRSLCGNSCDFETDRVYQITFSPVPYVPEGKASSDTSLNINFGYAPLFIIPAKDSKVSYEMTYEDNAVKVKNTGNTYIRFMVSKCSATVTTQCQATYTALAGRVKSFQLPDYLQDASLQVMVVNHDESYRKQLTLNKNKTQRLGE